jgi:hypothetical protein
MFAEWSAECSSEDPILVVPWKDPDGTAAFVDLRADPYAFDAIPEAGQHPPLMHALRALNAQRSPVFTAKCDAWQLESEELDYLHLNLALDLDAQLVDDAVAGSPCGFASYIDLVCRERSLFASFPRHEQLLSRIVRLAAPLDHPAAALDCVLRPGFLHLEGPQQGYAVSLYLKALGDSQQSAWAAWAAALDAVVALLRRRDVFR